MAKVSKKAVAELRFRVKDRTLTSSEMLEQIAHEPEKVSKALSEGVRIEAEKAVLDWLQTTPFGENIDDDGEVSFQMTGLEEALIVIAVIGTLGGLAVGYLKGHDDAEAEAASSTNGGNGEDGGGTEGNGDSDGEGNGGQDGGDGEGP